MNVILFGATGMIGQGVLRECLLDARVSSVLAVGRAATGQTHPKLRERILPDLTDYSSMTEELLGCDACFFCLGITSSGMSEADYRKITYDIGVAAARAVVEQSPQATFIFVSGAGTDATSKTMWARVKGEAENRILALPFRRVHAFRPAIIRPLHGIRSRTRSYRILYGMMGPLFPVLRAALPSLVTSTEEVARAMLNVAEHGADRPILENADIRAAAKERAEIRSSE